MARHDTALSTIQARTILDYCDRFSVASLRTEEEITAEALNVTDFIFNNPDLKDFFLSSSEDENEREQDDVRMTALVMSCALSALARKAVRTGQVTVKEYVAILANVKSRNEKSLKDYGAFGDLLEILVRCFFMGSIALVNWRTLTVKYLYDCDIISKKYGRIEVGHNGKSLTFGTLFDHMAGDYDAIVYGVFSEYDKKQVYKFCRNQELENAVDYVAHRVVYWKNKYSFERDMNELSRGKGITVKRETGVQVVYNESKMKAFCSALDEGTFERLENLR